MRFHRGDIVLLSFPFSERAAMRVRPAVVLSCDASNERLPTAIVAMITSATASVARTPTQVLVEVHTPEGREAGLLHSSVINCDTMFTVEQRLIVRTIGTLPSSVMARVAECLEVSLGLIA